MQVNIINQIDRWLAGHYGSRRGFVRTCWYRVLFLTGSYREYRNIDWPSVDRLVFVCKGNICRSAYAEAVARTLGVDSISCGVDTRKDFPANEEAIKVAKTKGVNLSGHRTMPIQLLDICDNDLFVVMEPWQAEYINQEYGGKRRCSLLGLWGQPVKPHIQDPYGASSFYFNYCFSYIEKAVHEIAGKICKTKQS